MTHQLITHKITDENGQAIINYTHTGDNVKIIASCGDNISNFITLPNNQSTNVTTIIQQPKEGILYLVDENMNQLYSPYDENGNLNKTKCLAYIKENNYIPLPAQYLSNGTWQDYPAGIYNWYLYYKGNDEYDEQILPITIEIINNTNNIVLSTNKNIISYGENILLSAIITDANNQPLSNKIINFKINNNTIGTDTSNNNGIATLLYTPQQMGNINITASSQEQESNICEIEVCLFYATTQDIIQWDTKTSGSNRFKVSDYSIDTDFYSVEFKGINTQVAIGNENDWVFACNIGLENNQLYTHNSSGTVNTEQNIFNNSTINDIWRVEVDGTNINVYKNNIIMLTRTDRKVSYPKTIRIYPDSTANFIDYIKINNIKSNIPSNININVDNNIVSKYHHDTCMIVATVTNAQNEPLNNQEIIFYQDNNIISTESTNSSGQAYCEYIANGLGDITLTANTDNNIISNNIDIEDCIYANIQQHDETRNGTTIFPLINNDIISDLPSTYTIEFDMKSSTPPTNGNEQRIYWCPRTLWTGNSQPTLGAFVGYSYRTKLEAGKRLNGTTDESNSKTVTPTEWAKIKIENQGSNKFYFYHNDDYYTWWTITGSTNYSEWVFGEILWSDTTFSVKNIKIKPY